MHNDLLSLARRIARLDPRRPKQATLRRSVSTAYYALFHYLVDQSCRCVMGTQHAQASYRQVIGRSFTHADMQSACKSFRSGGPLKQGAAKGLPSSFVIPPAVRDIARAFAELQEQRHTADYDLTARFKRSDILSAIEQVEIAIRRFDSLPARDEKTFFLACLWAWKNLSTR